jgi:dCTP deaminase
MILCDREIQEALQQQRLNIVPPPPGDHFASTSVDLTLAAVIDEWNPPQANSGMGLSPCFRPADPNFIYREIEEKYTHRCDATAGYQLPRLGFVLGYTREKIYLPHRSRLCARVEGKSSLARLGLGVHVTAPTIHAGFGLFNADDPADSGTPIRLEIWNFGPLPIELKAGMRICQLILEEVREVPTTAYLGQFNEQRSE